MTAQELIRLLPVSRQDKVNLALVYLGEKPACELSNGGFFMDNRRYNLLSGEIKYFELPDRHVEKIESALSELGLEYVKTGPEFIYSNGMHVLDEQFGLEISYDMKKAEELNRSFWASDHYNVGLALGFSKRNVEYWTKRRFIDRDVPGVKLTPEQERKLRFLSFIVERRDKEAVQEALEIAERYARAIENFDQELYAEVMTRLL